MTELTALEKNRIFSDRTAQKASYPEIPEMISTLINASKKILDLGCGEGGIIRAIFEKFPKKNITGVDISPRRINFLKKIFPQGRFLCEDVAHTSLKSKFDLIICSQVIEHVENDKKIVEEFYRLLTKEGFLYVTSVIKRPWAIYKYRNKKKFVLDPTHEKEYSSGEEFKKIFEPEFELIKLKKYPVGRKFLFFEIRIPGYFIIETLWKKKK